MTDHPSLSRRQLLVLGAGTAASALGAVPGLRTAGTAAAPAEALSGTPFPLVALQGKAPLGQVYDHPPNYETPTTRLIGKRNPPFTDAEDYYVRYRESDVYRVDPARFRLRVGGEAASEQIDLTLDDLRALPSERVGTVGACSGLGRGLVRPLVPGLPWTKGDVSCGEWTGVPLAAVLRAAGARPDASVVAFRGGRTIAAAKRDYWRHWALEPDAPPGSAAGLRAQRRAAAAVERLPAAPRRARDLRPRMGQAGRRDRHPPHAPPARLARQGAQRCPPLKAMSLITDPPDGTRVAAGSTIDLRGVAWDGGQGVRSVELSADDGRSWSRARLERPHGRYVWRIFHAKVRAGAPGRLWVLSRATANGGETQPMDIPKDVIADQVRQNNAVRTFGAMFEVR